MKNFLPTYSLNRISRTFYLTLFLFLSINKVTLSQTRIIVNPGLEFGVPSNSIEMLDANFGYGPTFDRGIAITSPWYTSHPSRPNGCSGNFFGNCHPIEVWGNGVFNVYAAQGNNFVELNAYTSSMIYQDLYLVKGDIITYYYRHRARSRTNERAEMVIENQNQVHIATVHQTRVPSSTYSWSVNYGTYTFNGADGVYRVGFRAIDVPGQSSDIGNFLDDVRVTLKPFIDLNLSQPASSCIGERNGSLFLRINGAIQANTTVAVELQDPENGTLAATPSDINLVPVTNSNGTATITNTPGTNIYLIKIPAGNYDGGTFPGYSYPSNDEDGIRFNITSVSNNFQYPKKSYKFQIKKEGTYGSSTNFDSSRYPNPQKPYSPTTNIYTINKCVCYNDPNTIDASTKSFTGVSLLRNSKVINFNESHNQNSWPMIRKSANLVLESNTKGFVISRLTTTQVNAIVSPQEGMMVYDINQKCLKLYNGTRWLCFNKPLCP